MTMIDLKTKNYRRAIFRADKSLEIKPHIKSFYRKAVA